MAEPVDNERQGTDGSPGDTTRKRAKAAAFFTGIASLIGALGVLVYPLVIVLIVAIIYGVVRGCGGRPEPETPLYREPLDRGPIGQP